MMSTDAIEPAAAVKLDAACGNAMQLQLAGELDLAGQLYGAILRAQPRHPAANYCLGMLHLQSQRPAEGLSYLLTALQGRPELADYWLGVLEALALTDRTDEAQQTLELARRQGLTGAAVDAFAKRLEARRAKAGAALEREQEGTLLTLVEKRDFGPALLLARGMTERFPKSGLGWKVLGALLPTREGYDAALAALETAARLLPSDAEAHVNLGLTLAKATRFDEAEFHLHRALEINPRLAAAHYRLAVCHELQGRFTDAEASLRRGIGLKATYVAGDDELSFSHLLFLMSHNPAVHAEELFAEHCRYGEFFETRLRGSWPQHVNSRDPDRCLKIGFVSGDLCNHAVASFVEPILAQLRQRPGLELHAYYTHTRQDEVSQRLLANFKTWNVVCALTDADLAAVILKDGIDILIDLSGHTGLNRLPAFARKPAPIQISWIGYPGTTGLRAMDYFLADPHFLPPGQFDRYFTEKLVHLPAQTPFQPQESAPPVNPLPALAAGRITFGSFNRLGKINAATIRLWCGLLGALPQAHLMVAGMAPGGRHGLIEQFAACGIAAERLAFHDRCGMDSYLALYHRVDMCLDTTPYNGGTTTIHALWMGVPTLTLAGLTPAARSGAAILGQMGLHEFVAAGAADFVAKGLYWAERLSDLAALRAGLRDRWRQSPGRRPDVIAGALDASLRRMWQRWCAGLPAQSFQCTALDPAG